MKPLIGINADYREATATSGAFSFVAAGYYDAIGRAGGVPVVIPPLEDCEGLGRVLDQLAGVVLTGGLDLEPRCDGYMLHPAVKPMAARREGFDRLLAGEVCRRRMPVMGIGAGMQVLNVTAGGTLFLHLPEDRPDAIPHLVPGDRRHRHAIDLEPDSLMARVYGLDIRRHAVELPTVLVTSCHHQAVDDVAPGFRATAACPDGVTEAIESVMPEWFAFGVQFHPEADAASLVDRGLFEAFVGEAKAWMASSPRRNKRAWCAASK